MKIVRYIAIIALALLSVSCSQMVYDLRQHPTTEIYLEAIDSEDYILGTEVSEGFVFDHSLIIDNADGTKTRQVYYKRVLTTITFDRNGGTFEGLAGNYSVKGKFGATVPNSIPAISRENYILSETNPWGVEALPSTFPSANIRYRAEWVACTDEIYLENIDDDEYALASSLPSIGFTYDHSDSDGSVRKSYYKRVRTTITLDKNGGTFADLTGNYTVEGKFGATVEYDIPALTRTNYVQSSTTPWGVASLPDKFPAASATYSAVWVEITDAIYLKMSMMKTIQSPHQSLMKDLLLITRIWMAV